MADDTQLYLRVNGVEHGPLTVAEVKSWVDQGKFRPTDYIRMGDKKAWVKAENLLHLKALFDEARQKVTRGAFGSWLDNVRTGKSPMVLSTAGRAEEEKRVAAEQAALAEERRRLEAEERALRDKLEEAMATREAELERLEAEREAERTRLAAEKDEAVRQVLAEREEERKRLIAQGEAEVNRVKQEREREMARLKGERERLEAEKGRLAEEERELAEMGKSIKARRRLPLVVALAIVAVAIVAGVPSVYYLIIRPGQEMRERNERLGKIEKDLAALQAELKAALDAGNTAKAAEIQKKIDATLTEKKKLEAATPGETPRMDTSRGRAKLAGLLRAEGPGAVDNARSDGAISAGLAGNMGGVRATYSRELSKNPGLTGHVVVSIRVGADGSVGNAHVVSSSIGNSAVESACTGAARASRFPPAAGEATLTYKFDFSP